jgi:hypothetical protein
MKKIIAAAVATAFVAPAMADVTISGTLSEYIVNEEVVGSSVDRTGSESNITIGASSEANNGLTVSGTLKLTTDGEDYYGEGITISHASFGSITAGNPSGAVDSIDDRSEVLQMMDPTKGHSDSAVLWTLPTLAEGLSVRVSYSPTDGAAAQPTGTIVNGTTNYSNNNTAIADDESGFAVTYDLGMVSVGYGQSDEASQEATYVGLTLNTNGLMVGIDSSEYKNNDGTKDDAVSIGATYTMGDVSLRGITSTFKDDGTKTKDRTAYGINYNLGGGATLIVESGSEDEETTKGEFTAVGVMYKF